MKTLQILLALVVSILLTSCEPPIKNGSSTWGNPAPIVVTTALYDQPALEVEKLEPVKVAGPINDYSEYTDLRSAAYTRKTTRWSDIYSKKTSTWAEIYNRYRPQQKALVADLKKVDLDAAVWWLEDQVFVRDRDQKEPESSAYQQFKKAWKEIQDKKDAEHKVVEDTFDAASKVVDSVYDAEIEDIGNNWKP